MESALSAADLAPGTVFADRYRVEGPLGRGGMGVVYRAHDLYLAEEIALKLLVVDLETNPSLALRFRQEVKLSRRVNHPNVVRVHDIGEHRGLLYMTMELVSGKTLRAALSGHREGMPLDQALWIARSMAEALGAAHAASIIHRDIKPSNVLIDEGGRVVVTDFGIARCLDEDLGLTCGLLGTMSYMAPEQASSGPVDARTDLYALGLVIYETLVGERPPGSCEAARARLEGKAAPSKVASVILRCLSMDPAGRPGAASEIVDAIAAASSATYDATESAPTVIQGAAPRGLRDAATIAASQPRLAVLPFRYRGPKEQDYLGEVLTDELVDALSRTRGLFVLGSGATMRFADARDPIAIGKELHVDAVIDGAVQTGGDRVRVSVRLLDAESGIQRWVQQRDGSLSDVFAFQESVVRRVAEALRVELHTMVHARVAPTAALDHYVEARRAFRAPDFRTSARAVELLDRALALSPTFAPAIAARALAAIRCWFLFLGDDHRDWATIAAESVARATAEAPDIAETHLAAAVFETQLGNYKEAVFALTRALEIAPAFAAAHEHLGILQVEAGHIEKGIEHAKIAVELDPSRPTALGTLARALAFRGDREGFEAILRALEPLERPDHFSFAQAVRQRDAIWRRDLPRLRELLTRSDRLEVSSIGRFSLASAKTMTGQMTLEEFERFSSEHISSAKSPRMKSLALQVAAETLAAIGELDRALERITEAARMVLVDICWLDRCPLFEDIRDRPEFIEARRLVRTRANAIWSQ